MCCSLVCLSVMRLCCRLSVVLCWYRVCLIFFMIILLVRLKVCCVFFVLIVLMCCCCIVLIFLLSCRRWFVFLMILRLWERLGCLVF